MAECTIASKVLLLLSVTMASNSVAPLARLACQPTNASRQASRASRASRVDSRVGVSAHSCARSSTRLGQTATRAARTGLAASKQAHGLGEPWLALQRQQIGRAAPQATRMSPRPSVVACHCLLANRKHKSPSKRDSPCCHSCEFAGCSKRQQHRRAYQHV